MAPFEDLGGFLHRERTGGLLLLGATATALVWANLAGGSYRAFWGTTAGTLTLAEWVSSGLLTVFFLVAGLELKRELTHGELAVRRTAALPLVAALGGMAVPAVVALVASGGRAAHGGAWAIPVATDIAFALGVLALAGSALPSGVRLLLLSMAVIDDLVAIVLVAVVFATGVHLGWLAAGAACCAGYALAQRRRRLRRGRGLVLAVAGVAAWACVHAAGVHPTIVGIVLGLLTASPYGEEVEHRLHPISAGVIVPVFALAAAGLPLDAVTHIAADPVARGALLGLVVGKPLGIVAGAWLAVRLGVGVLPAGVRWADVRAVGLLGGIGYTVSLLVTRLATKTPAATQRVSTAVLAASVIASAAGVTLLRRHSR